MMAQSCAWCVFPSAARRLIRHGLLGAVSCVPTLMAWLLAGLMTAPAAKAQEPTVPLTVYCFEQAADRQQIDRRLLWGLFATEGGKVGGATLNANGSYDLGPMQINDRTWLPALARMHFDGDLARARQRVQYDGCYNAQIGAWIFKQYMIETNGNMALAVRFYNSHNPEANERYARIYERKFLQLWGITAPAR